ncbi:hypothetical protein [Streptomyces sp. NBC_01320]|uniref:hypothetical protein n=1 Tax=Streptomyces sp. NBC_01320 TaxID=2903824 RepID=UPI002E12B903|nr:hypothetical protein OG395_57710 [Streptomyces sp. NBC_01320]
MPRPLNWQIGSEATGISRTSSTTSATERTTPRSAALPRATATLRNLAIGVLRQDSHPNIAAALRRTGRDHHRPLQALGLT